MTIKELITILNTYQQDVEIMVYNEQGEYYDPPEVEDWLYNEKYNYLVLS